MSSATWRRPSGCWRAMPRALGQRRRLEPRSRQQMLSLQRHRTRADVLWRQNLPLANVIRQPWAIRCLPWQPARRSEKLSRRAREPARTMSVVSFPGTSALVESRNATESSMRRTQPRRSKSPGSDAKKQRSVHMLERSAQAREIGAGAGWFCRWALRPLTSGAGARSPRYRLFAWGFAGMPSVSESLGRACEDYAVPQTAIMRVQLTPQ